jgi:hypothetical protein
MAGASGAEAEAEDWEPFQRNLKPQVALEKRRHEQ